MSNTYTQIYIHFVFAVKYRVALITDVWEDQLLKYITSIVQKNNHKMLAINSAYDHLHFFAGMHPNQSISKLMELVKGDSSEFINNHSFTNRHFNWQTGYGAFTHSRQEINKIVKYIMNQKQHHKKETFLEEYRRTLKENDIPFNEQYIFHEPLDDLI